MCLCPRRNRLLTFRCRLDSERHIFADVIACVTGFRGQERSRIRERIVRGGGAVTADLTGNCTHLVARDLRGDKCRKAMDMDSISVVPAAWVNRSVQNGRKEDEGDYCARVCLANLQPSPPDDTLQLHGEKVLRPSCTPHRLHTPPLAHLTLPRSMWR